jgi:hypothetical protein
MTRAESEARLDLRMIQAKYDGGGMPPALFLVLKQIETDIAWMQNADRPVPAHLGADTMTECKHSSRRKDKAPEKQKEEW